VPSPEALAAGDRTGRVDLHSIWLNLEILISFEQCRATSFHYDSKSPYRRGHGGLGQEMETKRARRKKNTENTEMKVSSLQSSIGKMH